MKSIVVGTGIQGKKRAAHLENGSFITVDVYDRKANFAEISDVPLSEYEVVFCCVPETSKMEIIKYCVENKKSVLVEKPLLLKNAEDYIDIETSANNNGILIKTAYNHRFEPNIVRMKQFLESNTLGKILGIRCLYGNGTANLVKDSSWRNTGDGVATDLFSHIYDFLLFFFGKLDYKLESKMWTCVTKCYDRGVVFGEYGGITVSLEATYLSWKNNFQLEIFGDLGSIYMNGLCKWSDSVLELRERVFPAGEPKTTRFLVKSGDPTWKSEKEAFFNDVLIRKQTDMGNDLFLRQMLVKSNLVSEF